MAQNAETVTIYPETDKAVDAFKVSMQEPSSDLFTMKDVIFTQEDDKLKVQAIEGDDKYERLTTKPLEKAETKLAGEFDSARQETPEADDSDQQPGITGTPQPPKPDAPGQHIA